MVSGSDLCCNLVPVCGCIFYDESIRCYGLLDSVFLDCSAAGGISHRLSYRLTKGMGLWALSSDGTILWCDVYAVALCYFYHWQSVNWCVIWADYPAVTGCCINHSGYAVLFSRCIIRAKSSQQSIKSKKLPRPTLRSSTAQFLIEI